MSQALLKTLLLVTTLGLSTQTFACGETHQAKDELPQPQQSSASSDEQAS